MDDFQITFRTNSQDTEINGNKVDDTECTVIISMDEAESLYWALEEYLLKKGKISERWS